MQTLGVRAITVCASTVAVGVGLLGISTNAGSCAEAPIECPNDNDCSEIIKRINYQMGIVKNRYYLMLKDEHNLFSRHNAIKNRHPKNGSWVGHKDKYEEEQFKLKQLILEAIFKKCQPFIPIDAQKWANEKAPRQPNRPEANRQGY